MKKLLPILFIVSSFFSYAQEDKELVNKMKDLKELFDMEVLTKKEYDSLTKVLVNRLVTKTSSVNSEQIQSLDSKDNTLQPITTPINSNANNKDSWWGIGVSYGTGKVKVEFEGLEESVDATALAIAFVNRWNYSYGVKFESSFGFGQSKDKEFDEKANSLLVGTTILLYPEPNSPVHFRGSISTSYSLEEKVEDFSKLNLGAGLGLGFDFNGGVFTVGIATSITNPYTGPLDLKTNSESFSAGLILKF
jgi:hypothetical protein